MSADWCVNRVCVEHTCFPLFFEFFSRFPLHLPQAGRQSNINRAHQKHHSTVHVYTRLCMRECVVVFVLRGIHIIPHRVYIQAFFSARSVCMVGFIERRAHQTKSENKAETEKEEKWIGVPACMCVERFFSTRLLSLAIGSMARASSKCYTQTLWHGRDENTTHIHMANGVHV